MRKYNKLMKEIRPFVDFNFNLGKNLDETLSPAQKAKITKYYNALHPYIKGKDKFYRPRNKKNLAKVKEVFGYDIPLKNITALPLPKEVAHEPRVYGGKKGKFKIKLNGITKHFIPIDKIKLVLDPEKEIKFAIEKYAIKTPHKTRFSFAVYANETNGSAEDAESLIVLYYIITRNYLTNNDIRGIVQIIYKSQKDVTSHREKQRTEKPRRVKKRKKKNRRN